MSNVIFNNFTSGIVSQKLAGNYNSAIYHNGCSVLENFSVMLQGGITRRPPLEGLTNGQWAGVTAKRLIPFTIDADNSYFIALASHQFRMWKKNNETGGWTPVQLGAYDAFTSPTPYNNDDIYAVKFAQSADELYLVHPSYKPQRLYYDSSVTPSWWKMSDVVATLTRYQDSDGNWQTYDPISQAEDTDGHIFKTSKNYPGAVAFLNNRLWFGGSDNHVNRYWASRPYDCTEFEFYEMVKVVDDQLTAESIIDILSTDEYSSSSTYSLGDEIQRNGYIYKCTTAIDTPEEWNSAHWQNIGSAELPNTYRYTVKPTVTEDCGICFDACGNDRIAWISAKNNIIVGTASGEYIIPGDANGINYRLSDLSSYGADKNVDAVQANSEIVYAQCGGYKVRSITYSSEGYANLDLTYQCDRLIAEHGKVVRMAWRKVPDPTLYVVLSDGTVAVLFYERGYGLCAWAHWTFYQASDAGQAKVKDICVCDNASGQEVLFLTERGTSTKIERLKNIDASESMNTSYLDLGSIPYTSEMVTNPYEYNSSAYGSSLGKMKRIRAIVCRLMNTKAFEAGYDEKYMKDYTGSETFNDVQVLLPGGYENFVQMTVRSKGANPLTLLAFSLDMEAER